MSWLGGLGRCLVGIEGRAGTARPGPPHHHGRCPGRGGWPLRRAGPPPPGKSDSLEAGQRGPGRPARPGPRASKGLDGAVEAIRALMVAKRSAAGERTQTITGQGLDPDGPDHLPARFTRHAAAALVAELASLRPRPGSAVGYATGIACASWDGARNSLAPSSSASMSHRPPRRRPRSRPLALYGIGPHTAALLLIAAGDNPKRLRSEDA